MALSVHEPKLRQVATLGRVEVPGPGGDPDLGAGAADEADRLPRVAIAEAAAADRVLAEEAGAPQDLVDLAVGHLVAAEVEGDLLLPGLERGQGLPGVLDLRGAEQVPVADLAARLEELLEAPELAQCRQAT